VARPRNIADRALGSVQVQRLAGIEGRTCAEFARFAKFPPNDVVDETSFLARLRHDEHATRFVRTKPYIRRQVDNVKITSVVTTIAPPSVFEGV